MPCSNRQLQQSQREDQFSSRAGVLKALRPFSGQATPDNLVDYINRELFPVVKQARERVNQVFPQVAEQAPSSNPLYYNFSESTNTGVDPTTGRTRLNNATQNTATVATVSEQNVIPKNVAAWLSLMSGSITSPLGVVTFVHQKDPSRFLRFNLNSIADNGTYWTFGMAPVESSSPNPFVEGDPVLVSFVAGVATGGTSASIASTIPYLQALSLNSSVPGSQSASITNATNSFISSGTVVFPMLGTGVQSSFSFNNVWWRMSGQSVLAAASLFFLAGASNRAAQHLSFADSNGASWGLNTSTFAGFGAIPIVTVNYAAPRALSAGTASMSNGTAVFSNSNNVSFGLNGSTVTASATVVATREIGVVSHVGGNVVSSVSQLAFSNASNVTWSLSTAANAATVLASVAAAGGGGITNINLSAGTTSNNLSALTLSNSNGVSFGLNGSTVTASYARELGRVAAAGGADQVSVTNLSFIDSSPGVAWTVSSNVAGVARVFASQPLQLTVSAGASSVASVSQLHFINTNNVGWAVSTAAGAASVRAAASINFSAGTTSGNLSNLVFSNSNGVSFGLNGSTVTASVDAAGGGGIAIFAATDSTNGRSTVSSGSVLFRRGDAGLTGAFNSNFINNVQFSLDSAAGGTEMIAGAIFRATANLNATGTAGFAVSKFQFSNSNGVGWGVSTTSNADGREAVFTASVNYSAIAPNLSFWNNFQGGGLPLVIDASSSVSAHTNLHVFPLQNAGNHHFPGNITAATMGFMMNAPSATTTNSPAFSHTYRLGLYTLVNSTQLTLVNSVTFTLGSATQSSANFNASAGGNRYMTVHSSQWSSQPVLSAGIQYWMGLQKTNNAASVAWQISQQYASYLQPTDFRGHIGSSVAVSVSSPVPFGGMVNTTNIPVSIGASQLASGTNTSSGIGGPNFIYVVSLPAVAMWNGLRSNYP